MEIKAGDDQLNFIRTIVSCYYATTSNNFPERSSFDKQNGWYLFHYTSIEISELIWVRVFFVPFDKEFYLLHIKSVPQNENVNFEKFVWFADADVSANGNECWTQTLWHLWL